MHIKRLWKKLFGGTIIWSIDDNKKMLNEINESKFSIEK